MNKKLNLKICYMDFITIQSKLCRSRVNKMLQEAVAFDFVKKEDIGLYKINPFILKGKGCSNETIERLQKEWELL